MRFVSLAAVVVRGFGDSKDGGVALFLHAFLEFGFSGFGFGFSFHGGILFPKAFHWDWRWWGVERSELLCEILDGDAEVFDWEVVEVA